MCFQCSHRRKNRRSCCTSDTTSTSTSGTREIIRDANQADRNSRFGGKTSEGDQREGHTGGKRNGLEVTDWNHLFQTFESLKNEHKWKENTRSAEAGRKDVWSDDATLSVGQKLAKNVSWWGGSPSWLSYSRKVSTTSNILHKLNVKSGGHKPYAYDGASELKKKLFKHIIIFQKYFWIIIQFLFILQYFNFIATTAEWV